MTFKTIATALLCSVCTPALAQGFGCFNTTQSPDSTVTPVDIGTVITLSVDTIDAVRADIGGVAMTPAVDPNSNSANTWTATSTAISDSVINVVVYTAGDTASDTCSWAIDVNEPPMPPAPAPVLVTPVPLMNIWFLGLLATACAGLGASRLRRK
ncbi:MAG: hypothetical protein CME59_23320 [Halioglobus sp.]|nr:hypothetical protein [Halioglobus sp.]|tara:strand:- start:1387 stop:1851 length:465 start_codon:yes stop_codon:yes gene_type:complete